MAEKAFTIQKTNESVIGQFHTLRDKEGLTPAAFLERLVNNQVNPVNSDDLQPKVNELEASLLNLQQENQSLQADKAVLETYLKESEEKNNALQAENQSLVQNSNGIKINYPQFVCSPSIDLASKIKRSAIYDIKKNKISKEDFLNQFTVNALNYYIKNEYSHILK